MTSEVLLFALEIIKVFRATWPCFQELGHYRIARLCRLPCGLHIACVSDVLTDLIFESKVEFGHWFPPFSPHSPARPSKEPNAQGLLATRGEAACLP